MAPFAITILNLLLGSDDGSETTELANQIGNLGSCQRLPLMVEARAIKIETHLGTSEVRIRHPEMRQKLSTIQNHWPWILKNATGIVKGNTDSR